MKTCTCCGQQKPLDEFYLDKRRKDGHLAKCKACCRAYRKAYTIAYYKTPEGFVRRTYNDMRSRVSGYVKAKRHLYEGLALLPSEEFVPWALFDETFAGLFLAWEASGHMFKLTPSIDRINPSLGYTLGNIRWVTHSKNSQDGNRSRYSQTK